MVLWFYVLFQFEEIGRANAARSGLSGLVELDDQAADVLAALGS